MANDILAFEREIIQLVQDSLADHIEDFRRLNVTVHVPKIRRTKEGVPDYESEICVDFSDNHGVFDVIEFFVYQRGKPTVQQQEIKNWLADAVADVVAQRQAQLANQTP